MFRHESSAHEIICRRPLNFVAVSKELTAGPAAWAAYVYSIMRCIQSVRGSVEGLEVAFGYFFAPIVSSLGLPVSQSSHTPTRRSRSETFNTLCLFTYASDLHGLALSGPFVRALATLNCARIQPNFSRPPLRYASRRQKMLIRSRFSVMLRREVIESNYFSTSKGTPTLFSGKANHMV